MHTYYIHICIYSAYEGKPVCLSFEVWLILITNICIYTHTHFAYEGKCVVHVVFVFWRLAYFIIYNMLIIYTYISIYKYVFLVLSTFL